MPLQARRGIEVWVVFHVLKLEMFGQLGHLVLGEGMVQEGGETSDHAHLVLLHLLVPDELDVWIIPVLPPTELVIEEVTIDVLTLYKHVHERLEGSREVWQIVIKRVGRIFRIPGDVHNFAGL